MWKLMMMHVLVLIPTGAIHTADGVLGHDDRKQRALMAAAFRGDVSLLLPSPRAGIHRRDTVLFARLFPSDERSIARIG